MLIGELSKRSGFSRDTIRYYEKIGLLVISQSARRENNYKDYPVDCLHLLKAIRKYKELGFTLEEIRELIVLQSIKVLDVSKLTKLIELKITGIETEIEQMHEMRLQLNRELQALTRKKTGHIIEMPEMMTSAAA